MKIVVATCFLLVTLLQVSGQSKKIFSETEAEKTRRVAWWQNDRFGMFIHWGLYALPARHEWVKKQERLDYPLQKIVLPGLKGKVKYAQFLHDGSEIRPTDCDGFGYKQPAGQTADLSLNVRVIKPESEIVVIELILN